MLGLTQLGVVHTFFSLIAVFTGAWTLIVRHEISTNQPSGKAYVWTTVVTCLTGFGIFQHGGFGVPHVLGILTLAALAIAAIARRVVADKWSAYIATAAMTTTYFFHWIPGIVETTTRVPLSRPLIASRDAPELQMLVGAAFVIYLIGVCLQLRRIRRARTGTISVSRRA